MNLIGKQQSGFTLIELMIAVMIMAVLASVAYPAYTDQVRKSKRAELITDIMQCAGILERRFTINASYNDDACDNINTGNDDYNILVDVDTNVDADCTTANNKNNCFIITATAVAGSYMADDKACVSFSYNERGKKISNKNGSTDNNAKTCWRS